MILDTSVVAKWFLEEEGTDKALKIRDDYVHGKIDVEIPDLLIYELGNVLRYKGFTGEEIKSAIKSIYGIFNYKPHTFSPIYGNKYCSQCRYNCVRCCVYCSMIVF